MVIGKDQVSLISIVNGAQIEPTLNNVILAPGLRTNLLSIPEVDLKGMSTVFTQHKVKIQHGNDNNGRIYDSSETLPTRS